MDLRYRIAQNQTTKKNERKTHFVFVLLTRIYKMKSKNIYEGRV